MTTMTETTWIELEGAPAIPGLRARRWRDPADYTPMAAVIAAASEAGQDPVVPTAENFRIEIEGEDGIDAASDITLVEVDGEARRARPRSGASFAMGRSCSTSAGTCARVPTARDRPGPVRGRTSAGRGTGRRRTRLAPPILLESFVEDAETGHKAILAEAGFEAVRHFFLMRVADLGRRSGRAAPRRPRDPAGHAGPPPGDLRRRGRGVHGPLGSPRTDRRPVPHRRSPRPSSTPACGPWPGTATRSLAWSRPGSGPRRTRGSASSAAGSSRSACAARGVGAVSGGRSRRSRCATCTTPAWRTPCSASTPRTRPARSACTRASASGSTRAAAAHRRPLER